MNGRITKQLRREMIDQLYGPLSKKERKAVMEVKKNRNMFRARKRNYLLGNFVLKIA